MPLTFAHPAAVLPFSRKSKYVDFLALILGSMAPDFEYFLRGMPAGEIGHTLSGFVFFNLPIVVIVYLIYKAYIHKTFFSHLPAIFQVPDFPKTSSARLLKAIVFFYSALFGMVTHIVWDSFTHLEGFMVRNVSILTYSVPIYDFHIPIYKFLQHGSTVVGIIAIIGYMYFQSAKKRRNDYRYPSLKQKLKYWSQIAILAILIFCLWYLANNVSFSAYGVIVVRIIDSALISLLIVSLCYKRVAYKKV